MFTISTYGHDVPEAPEAAAQADARAGIPLKAQITVRNNSGDDS